jgi:pyruvate/2-oxoglutarate dehydrogenase complex dihydrolipoamide acyltransferase (E2) component
MGCMLRRSVGLLCALALVSPGVARAQSVQPGDAIDVGCTLGWLLDGDDGVAYFTTAAHCADGVGQPVHLSIGLFPASTAGERLGQFRLVGDQNEAATDVALIAVDAAMRDRTLGTMRGHDTIPAGAVSPLDLPDNAALQMSGHGMGFEATSETREGRQGFLRPGSTAFAWEGLLPHTGGDSGGPLADVAGGRAMGLVKGARVDGEGSAGSWGPTVAAVIDLAARSGIGLQLRLAGQGPPRLPAAAPPPPASSAQAAPPPAAPAAPKRSSVASRRAACRKKARRHRRASVRRRALRRCARIRH